MISSAHERAVVFAIICKNSCSFFYYQIAAQIRAPPVKSEILKIFRLIGGK